MRIIKIMIWVTILLIDWILSTSTLKLIEDNRFIRKISIGISNYNVIATHFFKLNSILLTSSDYFSLLFTTISPICDIIRNCIFKIILFFSTIYICPQKSSSYGPILDYI
jgi:hypothetical protein